VLLWLFLALIVLVISGIPMFICIDSVILFFKDLAAFKKPRIPSKH